MAKSDVEQDLNDLDKSIMQSVIDETQEEHIVYVSGKAYYADEEGNIKRPRGRLPGCGKFGFPTVIMRIPLPLVPFIEGILAKCEELEQCRKNVQQNLLNTSVEFCFTDSPEDFTFTEEIS